MRDARLAHAGEEERLVDLSLEDGNAQLHALRDDLATVESCLSRELGGRQVNRHTVRSSPPVADGWYKVYIACRGWAQARFTGLRSLHRPQGRAGLSGRAGLLCLRLSDREGRRPSPPGAGATRPVECATAPPAGRRGS